MSLAACLKPIAISAALFACGVATPAFAEMLSDEPPLLLPLPPLPEPLPLPLPSQAAPLSDRPDAIGSAEMDSAGNIHLHLHAPTHPAPDQPMLEQMLPWSASQERIGYGEIEIDRRNPHYYEVLHHFSGLSPGQVKAVLPWRADEEWHCAFDPDRGPCPMRHLLPNGMAQC